MAAQSYDGQQPSATGLDVLLWYSALYLNQLASYHGVVS